MRFSPGVLALVGVLANNAIPARLPERVRVQLTVATIHAAALTTPRAATDTLDHPYLLVSRLGPHNATAVARLPLTSHLTIRADEALGAQPLLALELEPGDSIRLLLTLLEDPDVRLSQDARVADIGTAALTETGDRLATALPARLQPVIGSTTRWLGSVTVLLTNEAGTLRWRALDCAATCTVLTAPTVPEILAAPAPATGGVVELTGAGGTYHLNLRGQRLP